MAEQGDLVYITVAVETNDHPYLALRQSVAQLHDEDGAEIGSISTTAGLGGDVVFLEWKDRVGRIRMSQLLRHWVESFDAEGARRLPVVGPPEPPPPPPPPKPSNRLVDQIANLEVPENGGDGD